MHHHIAQKATPTYITNYTVIRVYLFYCVTSTSEKLKVTFSVKLLVTTPPLSTFWKEVQNFHYFHPTVHYPVQYLGIYLIIYKCISLNWEIPTDFFILLYCVLTQNLVRTGSLKQALLKIQHVYIPSSQQI